MSQKKPMAKPVWFKNTYFWIAAILLVLGFIGLIFGDHTIRDPGQMFERHLSWIYFGASVVMLINGLLSHRQTVQQYQEEAETSS